MLKSIANYFGYDAVESSTRRRAPVRAGGKTEDSVLPAVKRDRMIGTTQDVQRNFAVAAWAIRQHLNYVSSFSFQARTGNEGLDRQLESFIDSWSDKQRCDVAQKHPLRRMIRLAEAQRVVHGDFFLLKISGGRDRGRMQAIEGDRIATFQKSKDTPSDHDPDEWTQGVKLDSRGVAKKYSIGKRARYGSPEFDRVVSARSIFAHGFYDRFDQVRGISPVAASLNSLRDLYDGFDYALAKVKVSQLFGLAIYRDAVDPFEGADESADYSSISFEKGPQLLDLDPGDRAEFLESSSPASQTTDFLKLVTQVSLKALDIPYSFFDESHTNFYGSRAGLIQYLHGCKSKIEDLVELLTAITRWRLGIAVVDGEISLPSGADFETVDFEWVPAGVPWWDPVKEAQGHGLAISGGLDNPQRVCRATGTDLYENIDLIAKAQDYARSKGVAISFPGVNGAMSEAPPSESEEDGNQDEESPD